MNGLSHHYPMFDPRAAGAASSSGDDVHRAAEELRRRRDALAAASRAIPTGAMSLPPTGVLDRRAAAAAAAALAHREEELLRLRDAHARIVEAELAARAMRDRIIAARQEMERANIGDDRAAMDVSREAHKADLAGEARQVAAAREAEQEQDAGEPASAASAHIIESMERLVALQDQQRAAARQREMERIRQAELLGGQAFGLGAAAGLRNIPAAALTLAERERYERYMAYGPSAQLAEEMALRERIMQRRVLEEEVLKRQQQGEAIKRQQEEEAIKRQQEEAIKRQQEKEAIKNQQEEVIKRQQEEAIKKQREAFLKIQQQQQQQEAAHWSQLVRGMGMDPIAVPPLEAEREHISRLLQLQRMTDEDLIQRAAEVQTAQSAALRGINLEKDDGAASTAAALKRRILESQLARSSGLGGLHRFQGGGAASSRLDVIDQAYADAALSRGIPGDGGLARLPPAEEGKSEARDPSPAKQHQAGLPQRPVDSPNADPQKPLRYFNNGIEVDMDGNPLPGQLPNSNNNSNPEGTVVMSQGGTRATHGSLAARSPSIATGGGQAMDNIIAKFLTVVVSRVPEIATAVADLLPDGGDPAMLKREFPNVVDATLAELRSLKERFSNSADPAAADLHIRVTNCIFAIEPYQMDLNTVTGTAPPSAGAGAPPGAPGMIGRAVPNPSLDPNSCQPLMPNMPAAYFMAQEHAMAHLPTQSFFVPPHMMPYPPPLAFAPIVRADSEGGAPSRASDRSNLESPAEDDDLPMMAAYKSKKKAARKMEKAKHKKRRNAPKLVHKVVSKPTVVKQPRPPIMPKLVHHALFRGAFDANAPPQSEETASDGTLPPKRNMSESPQSSSFAGSSKSAASADEKDADRGSPPTAAQENPDGSGEEASPTKKRRISDESHVSNHGSIVNAKSSPAKEDGDDDEDAADDEKSGDSGSGSSGELLEKLIPKEKDTKSPTSNGDDGAKRHADSNTPVKDEANNSSRTKRRKDGSSPTNGSPPSQAAASTQKGSTKPGEESANSVVTEESEDPGPTTSNNDTADENDDGHFGASSVLLGLMGKK